MLPAGDAQLGADLGVREGRVFGEQGDQLLAAGRQTGERLTQRSAPLGRQQTAGYPSPLVRDGLGVQQIPASLEVPALRAGPGRIPARSRWPASRRSAARIADCVQLVHKLEPVVWLMSPASAPPSWYRWRPPDQRSVPVDEGVPRLLVAVRACCRSVTGGSSLIRCVLSGCVLPGAAEAFAALVPSRVTSTGLGPDARRRGLEGPRAADANAADLVLRGWLDQARSVYRAFRCTSSAPSSRTG